MNIINNYGEHNDERAESAEPEVAKISMLNETELEVITLVCQGFKDKRIAHDLGVTETWVRHQLDSISRKLDTSNRLDLVLYAYAHGIIPIAC